VGFFTPPNVRVIVEPSGTAAVNDPVILIVLVEVSTVHVIG
jgi:hypothetical protein